MAHEYILISGVKSLSLLPTVPLSHLNVSSIPEMRADVFSHAPTSQLMKESPNNPRSDPLQERLWGFPRQQRLCARLSCSACGVTSVISLQSLCSLSVPGLCVWGNVLCWLRGPTPEQVPREAASTSTLGCALAQLGELPGQPGLMDPVQRGAWTSAGPFQAPLCSDFHSGFHLLHKQTGLASYWLCFYKVPSSTATLIQTALFW